jgi:hypothetical protein
VYIFCDIVIYQKERFFVANGNLTKENSNLNLLGSTSIVSFMSEQCGHNFMWGSQRLVLSGSKKNWLEGVLRVLRSTGRMHNFINKIKNKKISIFHIDAIPEADDTLS